MKKWLCLLLALCMLLSLTACSGNTAGNTPNEPVDPASVEVELSEPITISFWHGIVQENMQQTLNEVVDDFNKGIGAELGITVESSAKGEMSDLENAVTAAIKAGNMPNVTMTEAASVVDWLPSGAVVSVMDRASEHYKLLNGQTAFYVCRDHCCLPPMDKGRFLEILKENKS